MHQRRYAHSAVETGMDAIISELVKHLRLFLIHQLQQILHCRAKLFLS